MGTGQLVAGTVVVLASVALGLILGGLGGLAMFLHRVKHTDRDSWPHV